MTIGFEDRSWFFNAAIGDETLDAVLIISIYSYMADACLSRVFVMSGTPAQKISRIGSSTERSLQKIRTTLEEVANECHLHAYEGIKKTKKIFGNSPLSLFSSVQIGLTEPGQLVAMIAMQSNHSNPSARHFISEEKNP